MRTRFSKGKALEVLHNRAARIAKEQNFDRGTGAYQLSIPVKTEEEYSRRNRAIEYGRMKAFEQFAHAIEEGFPLD